MPKRKNKTKEQLLKEAELKKETERQRKFVKEVFYPFLLKNSTTIEDAKKICIAAGQAVQLAYDLHFIEEQKRISKAPLSTLDISKMIDVGSKYDRDRELIALFKDEPIATASTLLNGMAKEIDGFITEEIKDRTLDTLKTHFL